MRKVFLFVLGFLGVFCVEAQQVSTMQFAHGEWDFGTIKEEAGKVSHRFEFTNTGKMPFVIEKVETSCGCTTPDYSRQPILPGRKGSIQITYDPMNRPGPFRREVTITSNGQKNSNRLTITGKVLGRTRLPQEEFPVEIGGGLLVARSTVGVGYLGRGGAQAGTLEYYNSSREPLSLGVIYAQPQVPGFALSFSAPRIQPGQRGVMTLSFDLRDADVWGRLNATFYLLVNGQKSATPLTASAIATEDFSQWSSTQLLQAPVGSFTAQYYHFGDVKAGEQREKSFTVTNTGKTDLVIRYVKAGPHMSTTLKQGTVIRPAESLSFTGTLRTEGVKPGRFLETTVIILNDPQRPMRELRLTANVI